MHFILDLWSASNNYSSKPQYDRTEFNDLTNTNYAFNSNSAYNAYFSQTYMHPPKQNYYGFQSAPIAPALNNQLPYTSQSNNFFDQSAANKNEHSTSDDSTNRTSPLEQASSEKLPDSPVSNESTDKINKNTSYDSNKESIEDSNISSSNALNNNNMTTYFTTQKVLNNTVKLSYTAYQLELLNAIYTDMKYPNSVQKTLIAKLIGITRDQVKIWFQNRRRKDTLVSQGKMPPTLPNVLKPSDSKKRRRSSDESENNEEDVYPSSPELFGSARKKQVVENQVIQSVLFQLRAHQNAPSRLSSKRNKPNNPEQADDQIKQVNKPIENVNILNQINDVAPVIKTQTISDDSKYKPLGDYNIQTNQALTPSSMSSFSLSSSSASSSSASSSEEDNSVNYTQQKYQTLQQPFSVRDYVDTRYMTSYYKQPKVHNQQYQQYNKLNPWANRPTNLNYSMQPASDIYSSNQNESAYRQYQINSGSDNYELASNYMPKYQIPVQHDLYNNNQPVQSNYQFMANNPYYCS